MAQHTPGHWVLDGHNLSTVLRNTIPKGDPRARHLTGDFETIARCDGENWKLNAVLIAAAPDLLQSVKDLLRICEAVRYSAGLHGSQIDRMEKAKAAIEKATAV